MNEAEYFLVPESEVMLRNDKDMSWGPSLKGPPLAKLRAIKDQNKSKLKIKINGKTNYCNPLQIKEESMSLRWYK